VKREHNTKYTPIFGFFLKHSLITGNGYPAIGEVRKKADYIF